MICQTDALGRHRIMGSVPKRCQTAPASGFYDLFATQQKGFKSHTRHIDPGLGYEPTFRSIRGKVPGAGISSLGNNLISRTPNEWRSSSRYIDPGSGSQSERIFRATKKMIEGPPDNRSDPWRSSKHAVRHVDESTDGRWKSSRQTVYPWYLEDHIEPEWRSTKKQGVYSHQPEWIPPFRSYVGTVPKRFYSIAAGSADARRKSKTGKRKSTMYNHFATTFDKIKHVDEFKKPMGGIKTRYKNEHQWPFDPLPPSRCKKRFYTHICHHEGVSTLLNHKRDYDYNSYIFL